MDTYRGFEVGDHGVKANDLNHGQVDGEICLTDDDHDDHDHDA